MPLAWHVVVLPYKSPLAVAYSEVVPAALLETMERHGRRMGLAMDTLELLGSDPALCESFVAYAELGAGDLFLADLAAGVTPAPLPRLEPSPFSMATVDGSAFAGGY